MDRDVIDLDAPLNEQFFDITEGQPVSEIPTNSEHDHFGREPVPSERCAIYGW
jgi:hypothetical protein